MIKPHTLVELAKIVNGSVRGEATLRIAGVNTLAEADENEITWATDPKYRDNVARSRAGAIIIHPEFGMTRMPAILCDDPILGVLQLLETFAPEVPAPPVGRDRTAIIPESATVDESAAIGPFVVLGESARIGKNTVLHAHVFVGAESTIGDGCVIWPGAVVRERCEIGNRVIIHPNATIGADGFGYHFSEGRHRKIPQIGRVRIEDDVEIGANTCIDRAKIGVTSVGQGTKIDNLVMVAHNVEIGPHCILAGQVGLAGSVKLGRYVIMAGAAGAADHVVMHDQSKAGARAVAAKDVPAGMMVSGIPARDHRENLRCDAHVRRLPEMSATLKELVKRIERLEAAADDQQDR